MLDDMSLSDRLKVARVWFAQAMAGEIPLAGRPAERFAQLLEECSFDALVMSAEADIAACRIAILEADLERAGREVPPAPMPVVIDLKAIRMARST